MWDDEIVQTRQMAAFQDLGDVFFPPQGLHQWSPDYYRPVVVLSYLLDQALFGPRAVVGPHAMVVVYHAACTLLVTLLARRLLAGSARRDLGALVAGLAFAVHPIHTESVSWITGRSDTVAALFVLPAALAALAWRDTGRAVWLVAAGLALLGGLLAKEVAAAGVALLPLLVVLAPEGGNPVERRSTVRRALVLGALLAALLVVYLGLRARALVAYGEPLHGDAGAVPLRALSAAAWYLRKALVPWPQSHFVVALPGAVETAVGTLAFLALAVVALRALRRGERLPALALGWFLLALAPSLAIAVRAISETPLAERYLYLPSVGVALAAADLAARAAGSAHWRRPAAAVGGLVLVAYAAGTVQRGRVWQDDLRLWSDATRAAPEVSLPWHYLGLAQQRAGDLEASLVSFRRALDSTGDPEKRSYALNNLGRSLVELGRLAEGEEALRAALAERPGYATAHLNLALVLRIRERAAGRDDALLERALDHLGAALEAGPDWPEALYERARCAAELAGRRAAAGDADAARELTRTARTDARRLTELEPGSARASWARELLGS